MSNKKKISSDFIVSLIIFAVPILLGIIFYKQLPDSMAIHFNYQNIADNFAPKWVALFVIPLFMATIHFISIIIIENDLNKHKQPRAIRLLTIWFIPTLSIPIQIILITYNLGSIFDISNYISLSLGILIIILGNYLPKSRQNFIFGIKLPWTLSNEDNWNKTHRLAGKVWVAIGLLMTIISILGYTNMLLPLILLLVAIPSIYSFNLYKKTKT